MPKEHLGVLDLLIIYNKKRTGGIPSRFPSYNFYARPLYKLCEHPPCIGLGGFDNLFSGDTAKAGNLFGHIGQIQ